MPIRLSDLQKRTKTIQVEYQGDTVAVTYLINVLTPAFLDGRPRAVEQITAAVESWDILDEDGNSISPTDVAGRLPFDFLDTVLAEIVRDIRGALEQEKKASSPG